MVTTVKKAATKSGHANKPGTKKPAASAVALAHKPGAAAKAPGAAKASAAAKAGRAESASARYFIFANGERFNCGSRRTYKRSGVKFDLYQCL